jgi:general secretion pathway protein M
MRDRLRERLRKAWESRSPRERRVIIILGVISSAVLYLWLVSAADKARSRLRSSLPQLRLQAEGFEQQAAAYERIKVTPSTPPSSGDLQALAQTQADALGLSHALNGLDAPDDDQVQVTFQAVPFADWLKWAIAMQLQRVRFEKGRIEALPEPGIVTVTGTFVRATTE